MHLFVASATQMLQPSASCAFESESSVETRPSRGGAKDDTRSISDRFKTKDMSCAHQCLSACISFHLFGSRGHSMGEPIVSYAAGKDTCIGFLAQLLRGGATTKRA